MILRKQRLYSENQEEKLYSTGDEMLDNLLERAFCEGYELGQQLFSDSKDEDEDEEKEKDKRKKNLKRLALGTGSALALAGSYQGYKHLERRKADKDVKEAFDNLNNILSISNDPETIKEVVKKYRRAEIKKAKKDMPGKLEMVGHALEHPVKSVKALIDNIKSKKQKQYSSSIDLSPIKNIDENNNPEENSDVKFYKNGSINFIYNGKTPLYNNFKDTLGTELHDSLEKLFENCSSMPITIDVVILVRELKNKPDRKEGEQGGVKNYKNGSIHVIYEGRTTKNDLKESLEKRLLSALDKSYKYMDSKNMPIIMDVIFNVRETK